MVSLEKKFGKIEYQKIWYPEDFKNASVEGPIKLGSYEITVSRAEGPCRYAVTVTGPNELSMIEADLIPIEFIVSETGFHLSRLNVPKTLREKVRWAMEISRRDYLKTDPLVYESVLDGGWYRLYEIDGVTKLRFTKYPTLEEALKTLETLPGQKARYIERVLKGEYDA